MLVSHHQNAGQTDDIMMANRSLENVAKLKYLGTTVRNENFIREEIKSGLTSGFVLLPFSSETVSPPLLSKNTNLKHTELYFACSFVWA
jgi:hypothetical protein